MSFIRPELKAAILRWREVIAGSTLALVALLLLTGRAEGDWMRLALAALLVLAGVALVLIGLPRGRFRGAEAGPGIVAVREGRIGYMGPLTGGTISLEEISAIEADGPPPVLYLHRGFHEQDGAGRQEPPLVIPLGAEGAEALFDALMALPGCDGAMLARASGARARMLIWKRAGAPPPLRVVAGEGQRRRLN